MATSSSTTAGVLLFLLAFSVLGLLVTVLDSFALGSQKQPVTCERLFCFLASSTTTGVLLFLLAVLAFSVLGPFELLIVLGFFVSGPSKQPVSFENFFLF